MEIYGVCLYVTISKNYREAYSPCQLKLERCKEELMWRTWVMTWSPTEDREHAMAGLEMYRERGYSWLGPLFCFNFKRIGTGKYMRYREGDLDEIF